MITEINTFWARNVGLCLLKSTQQHTMGDNSINTTVRTTNLIDFAMVVIFHDQHMSSNTGLHNNKITVIIHMLIPFSGLKCLTQLH
jgi:hypothetical protein